jgi:hypothetical protein
MIDDLQKTGGKKKIGAWKILQAVLLLTIITHSVIRDSQLEKQYAGDLRNRIVGARLQKDGRLPYFYFWQEKDGIRYFDPINGNKSGASVSPVTASPFFHQLLYPVCDLDQSTLSKYWLIFQYILLIAMIFISCGLTSDVRTRWLMIYSGVLFTTTEAWKSIIVHGQTYFFYAFLTICIISGILSRKKFWNMVSGLILAAWILNRPFGIIAIPLLFLYFKEKKAFLISTFSFLLLYALFILSSTFEKSLWRNYADGMRAQVKIHQELDPKNALPAPYMLPADKKMEGIDFNSVNQNMVNHPIRVYSENGNFFVLYRQLLHRQISTAVLSILSLLTLFSFLGIFFYANKKNRKNLLQVLIFAFSLYMIIEILSPIYRHQYNAVQWFPLTLAALLIPAAKKNPVFLFLALGLLLNIINISWIPMRHTFGELVWLLTLMYLAFIRMDNAIAGSDQHSINSS